MEQEETYQKSNFLNDLKVLSEGTEKPAVKTGIIGKILDVYNEVKNGYNLNNDTEEDRKNAYSIEAEMGKCLGDIVYSGNDIENLVNSMQMQEFDEREVLLLGSYVESLIIILKNKNDKTGKRTIIGLGDNRLDKLCYYCSRFDIVRFRINNKDSVFTMKE